MKSSKMVSILFALMFSLFHAYSLASAQIAITHIDDVNAENATVVEGDKIAITGSNFGIRTKKSSLSFEIQGQKINAEIIDWRDDAIIARVPLFPSVHKVAIGETIKITVTEGEGNAHDEKNTEFKVFNEKPLLEIIELKTHGFSDKFILNQFDKMTSEEEPNEEPNATGLNGIELLRLKAVGFDDDVIASFARHRQYLSIGVAGIWLNETKDLVTSPILRIFLSPRSYFDRREPFWSKSLKLEKFDFNIGYTTKTSTTDNGSEERSYLLVGFSFEMNRSALFNFGYALVPGDIEGRQTQPYFGITVDANILKDLGIIDKG